MIKEVARDIIDKNLALNSNSLNYYAIEEGAELTQELTKLMRGRNNEEELIKEMSDVYYTLSMLKQHLGVSDERINENITIKESVAREKLEKRVC